MMSRSTIRRTLASAPDGVVWRVASRSRFGAVIAGAALGASFSAVFWVSGVGPVAVTFLVASLIAVWLGAFRPWLGVDSRRIIMANPLSITEIALNRCVCATSGYDGIRIETSDGEVKKGWAVQKSNLMGWLDRPTRSDKVVEQINGVIRSHRRN